MIIDGSVTLVPVNIGRTRLNPLKIQVNPLTDAEVTSRVTRNRYRDLAPRDLEWGLMAMGFS